MSTEIGQNPSSPSTPDGTTRKRFDMFVLDLGWKSPISEVLRNNIDLIKRYQFVYNLYILNADQSLEMLRIHPSAIGNEPSLLVIDREAYEAGRTHGFGFKYNIGMVRDQNTASSILKWILAVLAEQKPGSDLTEPVRTVMHKEGIRGTIDILADITKTPFGEMATH